MHAMGIVAIVFGGTVVALAIIGSTILMAIKLISGGFSKKSQRLQADETKMIQKIYQGLSRMEARVEALETIILDRKEKES